MPSDHTSTGRTYRYGGEDFPGDVLILADEAEVETHTAGGQKFVIVTLPLRDLREIVAATADADDSKPAADQPDDRIRSWPVGNRGPGLRR